MTRITVLFCAEDYLADMESAIQQSCLTCALRPDRLFCDLPTSALTVFNEVKSNLVCPRNTVLFREGQPARGVFVLCEGRAKISVCSESGKRLTLRIAVPGEVLGLSAALSGSAHEVTADEAGHELRGGIEERPTLTRDRYAPRADASGASRRPRHEARQSSFIRQNRSSRGQAKKTVSSALRWRQYFRS